MERNIKTLAIFGGVFAATASMLPVQASVTETDGLGTTWLGTPSYLVAAGATAASFTTAEGNFGATGGANNHGALAQTFDLTSSGTLSTIQLVLSGAVANFNVELYDLGAYPASGYPNTSATYRPGSLTDLLTTGLSFAYNGGGGGSPEVAQLTFSGADAITLNAGELYAFQIDPTTSASVNWVRGNLGGPVEMYRMNQFSANNMGALNGATRDGSFALALAPVPEPASMAFFGMGALAGAFMLRRRNK